MLCARGKTIVGPKGDKQTKKEIKTRDGQNRKGSQYGNPNHHLVWDSPEHGSIAPLMSVCLSVCLQPDPPTPQDK